MKNFNRLGGVASKETILVVAGGYDLEMEVIGKLCRENGISYLDKGLAWGETSQKYESEIAQAISEGSIIIIIEPIFSEDYSFEKISHLGPFGDHGGQVIIIDHHGKRAGEPASILQLLNLVGEEPTRFQELVGANDSAYIPGMVALGATTEEVAEIRYLDRSAQGITLEQETEAERAIAAASEANGVTIVQMVHSKTATVADRLFSAEKPQNILILSGDGEVNYFGNGALCALLSQKFAGWSGGSGLGDPKAIAFWGGYPKHDEVKSFVVSYFA